MSEALRLEIIIAKGDAAKQELSALQGRCKHTWGEPVYNPEKSGGYTTPGDAPGTMGIDFLSPQYIPEKIKKRWSRKCTNCNKVEFTYKEKTVAVAPDFS